ncbi:MAG: S41 family peptidase [Myxococcota bacterium]
MSDRSTFSSSFVRVALGLALALPLACNKGKTEPETVTPAKPDTAVADAETPAPEATPAEDEACRDWSDVDVAALPALPDTPYTKTFEKVWGTILEKHYDPTLNCLDWPQLREEYGSQLADAKDQAAAFDIMTKMLQRLQQSHLAVVPPRERVTGEPRAAVKSGDTEIPIEVRIIDGEAVVVDAAKHGTKSGMPGGALLVAVNDKQVDALLADVKKQHEKEIEAAFLARRIIGSWLACDEGVKTKTLKFQAFGSTKTKSKKVKCRKADVKRLSMGNLANVPAVARHRMLPGTKVGYIYFNIWMLPLVADIEAAMKELRGQGMESLVIDLRGNPGGVGAMVVPVGRQFMLQDASLGEMRMRQGKQTFKVTMGKDPFTGPVALLVDEGTASTSEIFGQALQDLGRVQVFGAGPSQGAALPSLIEELPGGGMLQYVVADYVSPEGVAVEGRGVQPDTLITETREAFSKGRDPVLEAAVSAVSPAK